VACGTDPDPMRVRDCAHSDKGQSSDIRRVSRIALGLRDPTEARA
jgi:hypothetical protein